jgi:branched-subunit amino acid transport protein
MIVTDPAAGNALAFNPKIAAAVIAGVVAFFTRSSLWTIGVGMATLWLMQAMG